MKGVSKIAALCLLLLSPPLAADMLPILEIQLVARQAPFIVKGTVLPDYRLKIETQLKGKLPDDTIAVPDLAAFSDHLKNQMTDENDLAVFLLHAKLSDETCDRFKAHGLVGSTVLLLLDEADDAGTYALKGTMLESPDINHKHVAVKVLAENFVFRFGQMRTDAPIRLLLDRDNPTPDDLDAAVRYDRTLLLRLGYSPPSRDGTTGNYISLSLTNLSSEAVRLDLKTNLTLTAKPAGAEAEPTELPNEPWATLPDVFEPGQRRFLMYYLNNLDPELFQLQHGKAYDLTLTVQFTKDGKEQRFTATKTAKIP